MSTTVTADQFWQKAKEMLKERVQTNDFVFLDGLLKPDQRVVMQDVLVFASEQETFPYIHGLSRYLKNAKGHNLWRLTDLRDEGYVLNTIPGKGQGKGVWALTGATFRNLLELPVDLAGSRPDSARRSKASRTPPVSHESTELRGKKKMIWNYLQQERVGDKLLITHDHLDSMMAVASTTRHYVTNVFRHFEELGLLRKVSQGVGKGVELVFVTNQASKSAVPGTQVNPLIEALDREVGTLEAQRTAANEEIARQQARIQQIEELIAQKSLVRDEIKRLAGLTS